MKKIVMIICLLGMTACPVACVKTKVVQDITVLSSTSVESSTSTSTEQ